MRLRLPDWFTGNDPRRKYGSPESLFLGLKNQQNDAILCAQLKVLPTVKNIARQLGLPDDRVDDVLNQSTLIFLQKIESGAYQFQGFEPTTYLVEVARRVALNATRSQKRPPDPLENHTQIADPDAEKLTTRREATELVRHLLDQLGEPCASVIRLHHIEGYSDEEAVNQRLTKYTTTESLKVKRSDCMKKLTALAQIWKTSNQT